MKTPLSVIFIWHMHQPYYKDPLTGDYIMPWVYLHAIKDYYDMPAIVENVKGAKCVFNLVPSLVEQLVDYASGRASDPCLKVAMKQPSELSSEEKLFILDNFFSANLRRMIDPYPVYSELYRRSESVDSLSPQKRIERFSDQDFMDIQVWFFLTWTGEAARREEPLFNRLIEKGGNFTSEEKKEMFAAQREIILQILPLYKKLHESGKIEISVTPFFHPILPLLCDTKEALKAMPDVVLPQSRFTFSEDAAGQIRRGVESIKKHIGITPAGMWPSEGSVSDEVVTIVAKEGFKWLATDEGVLVKSLPGGIGRQREHLYHPYLYKKGDDAVSLFFRDHSVSDLVGFTYSQWDSHAAASDMIARIKDIKKRAPRGGALSIILDGENAWEHYPLNGYDFLSEMYRALAEETEVKLDTCSEYLASRPEPPHLQHIHSGSWINANYGIWIGHPEENIAWDMLYEARSAAINARKDVAMILAGSASEENEHDDTAHSIVNALYAAEGSDWFWWYGDDHFSAHADRFDLLFRRHLMFIYKAIGKEIPLKLYEPIKKIRSASGMVRSPSSFITPSITGLVGDYFEWLAAGLYDLSLQLSTMHGSKENIMQLLYYGYDRINLYLRIDGVVAIEKQLNREDSIAFEFICADSAFRVVMNKSGSDAPLETKGESGWVSTKANCHWQIRKILEARIPLAPFMLKPGSKILIQIVLFEDGAETARYPSDAPVELEYKGDELEAESWLI